MKNKSITFFYLTHKFYNKYKNQIPIKTKISYQKVHCSIFIKNSVYCLMKITLINPLEKIEDFSKFPI